MCGKRGVLGCCTACGLLMHYMCIPPVETGGWQLCPRCKPTDKELPDEPWKMGIQNLKFEPHRLRPLDKEPGEDGRLPCSVPHH